ncbi:MAG: group I truncated hemoglobin [Neptuniibacter sp.]
MKTVKLTSCFTTLMAGVVLSASIGAAEKPPTVEEQITGLQTMCADTEQARNDRHTANPLYFRLGEYDKIHRFTTEVVRLHFENSDLDRIMEGIDGDKLAKNVADFVSTGTGGPKVYQGRDMPTAHARLKLTDADFLAAGGDIVAAMQNMGYGQPEIDEFVCILVSMKDLVVMK